MVEGGGGLVVEVAFYSSHFHLPCVPCQRSSSTPPLFAKSATCRYHLSLHVHTHTPTAVVVPQRIALLPLTQHHQIGVNASSRTNGRITARCVCHQAMPFSITLTQLESYCVHPKKVCHPPTRCSATRATENRNEVLDRGKAGEYERTHVREREIHIRVPRTKVYVSPHMSNIDTIRCALAPSPAWRPIRPINVQAARGCCQTRSFPLSMQAQIPFFARRSNQRLPDTAVYFFDVTAANQLS